MDQQVQPQQLIKPIEVAAEDNKLNEQSIGQKTSDAVNNASSAVTETASGFYNSIKKALGIGSSTSTGGRRKKKRTKRAKKSAKKTKRSKK